MNKKEVIVVFLLYVTSCAISAPLNSSSTQDFGRTELCPGERVTFTCTKESAVHTWTVERGGSILFSETIVGSSPAGIENGFSFGSPQILNPMRIISAISVDSTPEIDGAVVTCSDGTLATTDPDPQNTTIQVLGLGVMLPAPVPLSPSSVRVSPMLQNTPNMGNACTGYYLVEVFIGAIPILNITNTSADIVIPDLNLCRNTYSFTALFVSNSAYPTSRSSPVSPALSMSSDLELDSVTGVTQTSNGGSEMLEWNPPANAPPMCIDSYVLTVNPPSGRQYNTSNTFFPISSFGLSVCVSTTVRISPRVSVFPDPVDSSSGDGAVTNIPENFTVPDVEASVCYDSTGNQRVIVSWQNENLFTDVVDNIMVGYSDTEGSCNASLGADTRQNHTFSLSSGSAMEVCVLFKTGDCQRNNTETIYVSPLISLDVTRSCPSTLFTVALTPNTSLLCDNLTNYQIQAVWNRDQANAQRADCSNIPCIAAMSFSDVVQISGRVATSNGVMMIGNQMSPRTVAVLDFCGCNLAVCVVVPICCGVVILLLLGVSILVGYRFWRKDKTGSKSRKGSQKQELTGSSPPPEDHSLYADPNKIEHQNAPGTDDQYAMVDVSGKKKKPTQQAALYQDPNAIEHQTVPSGDTYAVVDKPKKGSSKKREPDVVPPGSTELNYADIDVAASRRKPKPAAQLPSQDPGRVEYADIGEQAAL